MCLQHTTRTTAVVANVDVSIRQHTSAPVRTYVYVFLNQNNAGMPLVGGLMR
jgi:hypothetical protein